MSKLVERPDFLKKHIDNLFLLTVFTSVDRTALCSRYRYTYLYIYLVGGGGGTIIAQDSRGVHTYMGYMPLSGRAVKMVRSVENAELSRYLAPYRHSARTDERTKNVTA